jgi:hypothetical protein
MQSEVLTRTKVTSAFKRLWLLQHEGCVYRLLNVQGKIEPRAMMPRAVSWSRSGPKEWDDSPIRKRCVAAVLPATRSSAMHAN